eukprot:690373-Prymnesium_polylepis.1
MLSTTRPVHSTLQHKYKRPSRALVLQCGLLHTFPSPASQPRNPSTERRAAWGSLIRCLHEPAPAAEEVDAAGAGAAAKEGHQPELVAMIEPTGSRRHRASRCARRRAHAPAAARPRPARRPENVAISRGAVAPQVCAGAILCKCNTACFCRRARAVAAGVSFAAAIIAAGMMAAAAATTMIAAAMTAAAVAAAMTAAAMIAAAMIAAALIAMAMIARAVTAEAMIAGAMTASAMIVEAMIAAAMMAEAMIAAAPLYDATAMTVRLRAGAALPAERPLTVVRANEMKWPPRMDTEPVRAKSVRACCVRACCVLPLLSLLCAHLSTVRKLATVRSRLVERVPTDRLRPAEAVERRRHESGQQQVEARRQCRCGRYRRRRR